MTTYIPTLSCNTGETLNAGYCMSYNGNTRVGD